MLQLVADMGELHRMYSTYNTSTVVELLRHLGVQHIYSAVYPTPEHPVFYALQAGQITIEHIALDPEPYFVQQHQLWEYLNQYKQGKSLLGQKQQLDREIMQFLQQPHTVQAIHSPQFLQVLADYHNHVTGLLEEGVATAFRQVRIAHIVEQLKGKTAVVLAAVDDIPEILNTLPEATVADVSGFKAGEASRLRALADRASLLAEEDDLDALLHNLQHENGDTLTPKAELQYWAANIYLAVGDLNSAHELLMQAGHAQFEYPLYLPGLIYARLGQVRDAKGERENALRAYKAVLALNHAPQVALETARAGLETPFELSLDA